ncbi:hypothetical protein, partial [Methylomonas lenta]|uniref:hypothetical protein n=1 Tax=Methylomonas lenta TaxID=980561 RepID=UPI001E64C046
RYIPTHIGRKTRSGRSIEKSADRFLKNDKLDKTKSKVRLWRLKGLGLTTSIRITILKLLVPYQNHPQLKNL